MAPSIPANWYGEVCQQCERHNPVSFHVPDEMWRDVAGDLWTVLCLACFDTLAAPLRVRWDEVVKLNPVSTETWRLGREGMAA